jgi:UDP:flavonoid glycosyltransferase YjiC (YdhE family)
MRKRILFFVEGATLAHVGRPIYFARFLNPEKYELALACDRRYEQFYDRENFSKVFHVDSIATDEFNSRLFQGKVIFTAKRLISYVENETKILDEFQPHLIISDLRLSLAVSARLAKLPYATLSNPCWSPYYRNRKLIIGDHPLTHLIGVKWSQRLFTALLPLIHRIHCAPLNKTFGHFGLKKRLSDIGEAYTEADFVLYSDTSELYSLSNFPANNVFLGPWLWEPVVELPDWWSTIPSDRKLVYVTLGSSGAHEVLKTIVDRLGKFDVSVMLALSGQDPNALTFPENFYVADYLPGIAACEKADLVVFNGGSGTAHQASYAGTPMLAVCKNTDQFMEMESLVNQGSALVIRSDTFNEDRFSEAVTNMLGSEHFGRQAKLLASSHEAFDTRKVFNTFVKQLFGPGGNE